MLILVLLAATPVDFLWDIGPAPYKTFVSCSDSSDTYCLEPGPGWLGICMDKTKNRTLAIGDVSINNGAARFSACDEYRLLLSPGMVKKLGAAPDKGVLRSIGCVTDDVKQSAIGDKWIQIKTKGLSLRVAVGTPPANPCDKVRGKYSKPLSVAWSGARGPLKKEYWVELLGDLNGDGAPEMIVAQEIKNEPIYVAATLVTLKGEKPEVMGIYEQSAEVANGP